MQVANGVPEITVVTLIYTEKGRNSYCVAANKVLEQKKPSSACSMILHDETYLAKPR